MILQQDHFQTETFPIKKKEWKSKNPLKVYVWTYIEVRRKRADIQMYYCYILMIIQRDHLHAKRPFQEKKKENGSLHSTHAHICIYTKE